MDREGIIASYFQKVKELHPSWSNAEITAKAVRMYYFKEKLEEV